MPTPLYLNGFENRVDAVGGISGSGALWDSVSQSNVTVTNDATHRGAGERSMKCAVAGGGVSSNAVRRILVAAQTRLATRFYFRKSSNNPTQSNCFLWECNVASGIFFEFTLRTDGAVELRPVGGTGGANGSASPVLTADQWYCIDIVIDVSSSSFVARMWVDGTQMTTDCTTTGSGAGSITAPTIGKAQSGANTNAFDLYYDDYIVGTASSITDKFGETDGIVGLVPDGDGTHSPSPPTAGQFDDAGGVDISGSNPAWDNLDSGDLTQTTERVQQTTAGSSNYLEVTFGSVTLSAAAPVAVQGEVGLNTDGTNAFSASTRMRNGTTETVLFTGDWSIAAGTKSYKRALVAVADQTELDGLRMRIGYGSSQPAIPYWEGLMYEVDIGASAGFELDCQPASYSWTGVQAQTAAGILLNAQPASYAWTGNVAAVPAGRAINAQPGAYSLTGFAASFLVNYVISALPGGYALSGFDAGIVAGRVVNAQPGSYTWTGILADLVYEAGAAAFSIDAQPASYAFNGEVAGTLAGRVISADTGTYSWTGVQAQTAAGIVMNAAPGSYLWTGVSAGTPAGRAINAQSGAYAWTGNVASVVAGRVISALPGAYTLTGVDAGLVFGAGPAAYELDCQPTAYAFSGVAAGLISSRIIVAGPGAYSLVGLQAGVVAGRAIAANPATYSLTGVQAGLIAGRMLVALPGAYTLLGFDALLASGDVFFTPVHLESVTKSGVSTTGQNPPATSTTIPRLESVEKHTP